MAAKLIHVVAAVIQRADGQVFIARRPEGGHQGGKLEFPGGKVETGEKAYDALVRELQEELGITVQRAQPLIRLTHHYPEKSICLDVWQVLEFAGEPYGAEGQPVYWMEPQTLDPAEFPEANVPIITALKLPRRLQVSAPFTGSAEDILETLSQDINVHPEMDRLLLLRLPDVALDVYQQVLSGISNKYPALEVLVDRCEALSEKGVKGVHLKSSLLMALESAPEAAQGRWVSAAVHNEQELRHAEALGLDFVVLGTVLPSQSHPGGEVLGWERFEALIASTCLPVWGIGGLGLDEEQEAFQRGAQGIAGISTFRA